MAALVAVLAADPTIGLAAPALELGYHAQLPRASALTLKPLFARLGHVPAPLPTGDEVLEVEQPAGACLVARAEIWQQLGGFDGDFFLWFEDVDLARRSRQLGLRNVVVGRARAEHRGAASFVQVPRRAGHHLRLESTQRYVDKHHPGVAPLARLTGRLAHAIYSGARGRAEADALRTPSANGGPSAGAVRP
jgi:GT2 family glycosyltransferase